MSGFCRTAELHLSSRDGACHGDHEVSDYLSTHREVIGTNGKAFNLDVKIGAITALLETRFARRLRMDSRVIEILDYTLIGAVGLAIIRNTATAIAAVQLGETSQRNNTGRQSGSIRHVAN